MTETDDIAIRRLGPQDRQLARGTFALMASVFGETQAPLSDEYLDRLLVRTDFWAFVAMQRNSILGGLTAHTLMMTAFEGAEVFLYDIAVASDHRRLGIGRSLIDALRRETHALGISTIFVLANDEDIEALEFYKAVGGRPSKVTLFEFDTGPRRVPARLVRRSP